MQRRFATLDVFTERRFVGNPLAVVLDAEGLDTAAMQSIAREFNHPETVFVLPPQDKANRARLRIFTPARELPFAGHPTVGTAVLLAIREGAGPGSELILEENVGPVRCLIEASGHDGGRIRFALPQLPTEAAPVPDDAALAAALSLEPRDIGFERHRPSRWSAGNPFVFVPLGGLAVIARARPNPARFDTVLAGVGTYLYCRETVVPGHDFHARMFAPHLGVLEDPATGSAAAAFAGVLAREAGLSDGDHALSIEQGYEMGRASLIRLSMTIRDSKLTAASIGGDAVVVTQGTIEA
jgi:trans-2,3-dihydro-3-hydroxyanthranilate isomerase